MAQLKSLFKSLKKDKKHTMLIFVLVGVLMLVIAWPTADSEQDGTYSGQNKRSTGSGDLDGDLLNGSPGMTGGYAAADGYGLTAGDPLETYVAQQEQRLEAILSSIEGAGEVRVMITASATREKVIEKDAEQSISNISETDSSGGMRLTQQSSSSETAIYAPTHSSDSGADNSEGAMPYVVKELVPQIEGVVIASKGAADEFVVDQITQSVSVLFNLPVHKIKVVKMNA